MREFSVKSYDNLKSAEEIIINTARELREELEKCNNNVKGMFSESSFYGPIASHIESALNIINTATNNNIASLNEIANSINKAKISYQNTDNKVSNDIGGL